MKIAGIVCEYNPFHNGHLYHIEATKAMGYDAVVAVMSGNLVQRAEPAFFSKWTRAKAAVACGADLVIELPVPYVLSSAEGFAYGAVSLLNAAGIVDAVSFGSECGDAEKILSAAKAVLSADGSPEFTAALEEGLSFPAARKKAVEALFGSDMASLLDSPNDILGVEYCKAMLRLGTKMQPVTVQRKGAAHDSFEAEDNFASGSDLRRRLLSGEDISPFLPKEAAELFREEAVSFGKKDPKALEQLILYTLAAAPEESLERANGMGEGLHHKLKKEALRADSLEVLYDAAKSKRYTHSRVRRAVLNAVLDIQKDAFPKEAPYFRVLDLNEKGQELLRLMKKRGRLPIYHSFADLRREYPYFGQKEELAEKLFVSSFENKKIEITEYRHNREYSVNRK